jgi:hypothetical protein
MEAGICFDRQQNNVSLIIHGSSMTDCVSKISLFSSPVAGQAAGGCVLKIKERSGR